MPNESGMEYGGHFDSEHVSKSEATACSKAAAETINRTMMVDVDISMDRFWVRDNFGDDAQVRLEPNGNVYLCYTSRNRSVIESREIPWAKFLERFRQFVHSAGE